jgi:pilus assembly protein CpaB
MAAKPKPAVIIGIIAIAIAVVASVSLYNYLKGQEEEMLKQVGTEKVMTAVGYIPVGSIIDNSMVQPVEWPSKNLPEGTFSSSEQVVGRRTLEKFVLNEPILQAKLIPPEGMPGFLVYKIPEGHRAITVGVDQVAGVAGFVTPGNMVDVVLTITPLGAEESISKIVLQNIPVLATGQIVEQTPEGQPVVVPTVTLDVTPENAENLAVASTQGRLQLVLRSANDTQLAETQGASITKIMTGFDKALKKVASKGRPGKKKIRWKAKKKTKVYKVEVWRDGSMKIETFRVKQT